MCFSATASFMLGGVLVAAGSYTVKRTIDKKRKNYLMLAAVPIFFGIQQIVEGFVWLILQGDSHRWLRLVSFTYLFFPFFFWLCWIPTACYMIEERRPQLLSYTVVLGAAAGVIFYLPFLLKDGLLDPRIINDSISYFFGMPYLWQWMLYCFVLIGPLFLSSNDDNKIMGTLALAAAVVAEMLYQYAFASVWCFFGAITSLALIYVVYRLPKKDEQMLPNFPDPID